MKRFYVHPDYIDPSNNNYNVVDPADDRIIDSEVDEYDDLYTDGEQVSVEIVTQSGNWDSLGVIRDIFTDEWGTLLSVEVDWGSAVLVPSES